jgi:flagellar hook assembly protein FlgD
MPGQHRSTPAAGETRSLRRELARLLVVILAIVALLLTSSALNLVTNRTAAQDGAVKRAVVVAGPVHERTVRFREYARKIADVAEAQGMAVTRIFHPYAPAKRVKALAQGADLFVYVGHGNGWPSPYGPFQERTKNGLGLDAADPDDRGPNTVIYKGADWLRENVELAPDAVVILSHLSYASGNASTGMPIPTRSVAVERVDNFANGFLSIGARVVWALGWQPGGDVVRALFAEDATMDAVFQTRDGSDTGPLHGWIGWSPSYHDSVRIPGARIHIDPDPQDGFLRALTGDLTFSTTEWRDAAPVGPPDVEAPVVSGVRASQDRATIAGGDPDVPVFTPNGDGISDSVAISFDLSEGAFLEAKVRRDGRLVRGMSSWAQAGGGSVTWNGRRDGGRLAAEGKYNVYLTPTDRAGNKGETRSVSVKILNSIKNPMVKPELFWARDQDALASTSALKARLTRPATVSWVVRDARGAVVRRGIEAEQRAAGDVRFVWDGRNDAGGFVPDGRYVARVRVTRPGGSYAHEVTVRHMPFMAWTPSWIRDRGDTITLKVTSAEPLRGKPVVTANQPGIKKVTVPAWRVKRLSPTAFTVVVQTRDAGSAGGMKVRVTGIDADGGTNTKVFTLRLR